MTPSSTDGVTGVDVAAIRARYEQLVAERDEATRTADQESAGMREVALMRAANAAALMGHLVPALLDALAEAERQRDEALTRIVRVEAILDDSSGPDSWSHTWQGEHAVFAADIRAALTPPHPPSATVAHETTSA